MRRVGDRSERAEVVDPVQGGNGCGRVVAAEEEVDGIGLAGAEGSGELVPDPRGGRGRSERDVVAAS